MATVTFASAAVLVFLPGAEDNDNTSPWTTAQLDLLTNALRENTGVIRDSFFIILYLYQKEDANTLLIPLLPSLFFPPLHVEIIELSK